MGRDNHPRERQAAALKRKKAKRPPYDRVLIVTEGAKTEPLYFEDIRKQKKIATAHVEIVPSDYGTAPDQVVAFAHDRFCETREFDQVFAVFDRDEHLTYSAALQRAQALDGTLKNDEKRLVRFKAVPSVTCFELWLLLHFQDVFAIGDRHEPIAKLKAHLPGYAKGAAGLYARTEPFLPDALRRAAHLRTMHDPASGADPYTDADELVLVLIKLRD